MPRLKSYKRIITNDFDEEDRKLVSTLGGTINDAFGDLFFTMNNRVDLATNIACTVRDVEVIVDASGRPINRTVFTVQNPTLPIIGITVILAINLINSNIYPTSQPFVSFVQVDGGVLINNITGLQANQRYLVRLVAWN